MVALSLFFSAVCSPRGRMVLLLRHKHSLFGYAACSLRGRMVLLLRHKHSLRLYGVLATRPHSAILMRQTCSLKFSLSNGRPLARSMETSVRNYGNSHGRNSSAVSLTRFRSLCLNFHTAQSYTASYHTAVLCIALEDTIYSVCAMRLLRLRTRHCLLRQRFSNGIFPHGISHRLQHLSSHEDFLVSCYASSFTSPAFSL